MIDCVKQLNAEVWNKLNSNIYSQIMNDSIHKHKPPFKFCLRNIKFENKAKNQLG